MLVSGGSAGRDSTLDSSSAADRQTTRWSSALGKFRYKDPTDLDLTDFGAVAGEDATTALEDYDTFLADKIGGRILIPEGEWGFSNPQLGSTASLGGKKLTIAGTSGGSRLVPVANNSQITIASGVDSFGYGLVIEKLHLGYWYGDTPVNHAYTAPLLVVKGVQSFAMRDVTARMDGTGTLMAFEDSYEGLFESINTQLGRYAVPLVWKDGVASNQQDTIKLTNFLNKGTCGAIFNGIAQGLHTVRLDGYKTYVFSLDIAGPSATSDREKRTVGQMASAHSAGVSSLTLSSSSGFYIGDPVFLGYGRYAEVNKVTNIVGNTLSLAYPTQFAHDTAADIMQGQVIGGGVGVSFSSNTQLVHVYDSHFEGNGFAVMLGATRTSVFEGNMNACPRFIRICGAAEDIDIGVTEATGGTQFANENVIFDIPAQLTSLPLRINPRGPFRPNPDGSGPAVVPFLDPGNHLPSIPYDLGTTPGGEYQRTRNFTDPTRIVERLYVDNAETYELKATGAQRWEAGGSAGAIEMTAQPSAASSTTAALSLSSWMEALRLVARAAGSSTGGVGLALEATSGTGAPRISFKNSIGTIIGYLAMTSDTVMQILDGSGATVVSFDSASETMTFGAGGGTINFLEKSADPSAPSANQVLLYSKDNGSGKTGLYARFPTGAVQQVALEP